MDSIKKFEAGDIVRDRRFNVVFYGKVIHVDHDSLIVQRVNHPHDKGNYGVPAYMMELVSRLRPDTNND